MFKKSRANQYRKQRAKRITAIALALVLLLLMAAPAMAAEPGAEGGLPVIVLEHALSIASTLLVTLIGVGGTWLVAKIGKREQLANISAGVKQVVEAAQITVGELEQTLVKKMKNNGLTYLSESQIEELKAELLNKTAEKLSKPAVDLLEAAKVDVTALIMGAGEDWIGKLKAA